MRTDWSRATRSPAFRVLWYANLAGSGATWMERVATGWLALEIGGPFGVGVALAARMLAFPLFGLVAGTLADRIDRRRLVMVVGGAGAALSLALALLVGTGAITFWEVAVVAFLNGLRQVAETPARQALILDTVPREDAANAIALQAVATGLLSAVGAIGGGGLIALFGVATGYVGVALARLLAVAILSQLKLSGPEQARKRVHPPFHRAIAEAGQLILHHSAVRTLVLVATTCEIFGFSYMAAVPTLVRSVLHAGPEGFGALSAAGSIGATVSVLILAVLTGRGAAGPRREPMLAVVFVLYGVGVLALGSSLSLAIAFPAMVLIGGCSAAFDALQQTLVQLAVPEDQRGRAVGIWVFSLGSGPVGNLEMGELASTLGPRVALLGNGVLLVVSALALIVRAPSYRYRLAGGRASPPAPLQPS